MKDEQISEQNLILETMMWGMIPPWHKSESPKGHGVTTNNARIENIKESKLYRPSLVANKRCVVVCDGFYGNEESQRAESVAPSADCQHWTVRSLAKRGSNDFSLCCDWSKTRPLTLYNTVHNILILHPRTSLTKS